MNSWVVCVLITLIISSTLLRIVNSNVCTIESCFPPTWDLETVRGAKVTANSTCGLTEDEDFCVKQKCDFKCNNAVPSKYHGVNLTVDTVDDDTYWKSKNLDENVVVELDLRHSYFFVEITATFAFSYPAAMYFSKSKDHGRTWHTLAYFSSDCGKHFNMTAVRENDRDGFIVQCFRLNTANTDLKASYQPWRDQQFAKEIHKNFSLQQEFLATNFRMVLVKFEAPPDFKPDKADERNFYFAVEDWYIRGSCYCHGQSAECNKEERWKCNCLKNTTGENCQECLSLFNNEKYESGKACTECQCNNHSSRCEYDQNKDYGVCLNCTGYTTGDSCNQCLPFYYEELLPIEHPDRCQACNCHPSGITGERGSDICNQNTGQCDCKRNVTGRTCGVCKDGYWNLAKENPNGCQICVCESAGTVGRSTVCEKNTGQCPCRERLVGLKCTECEDGYYGLAYHNPTPCKDCSCSAVGSVNITCDQTTGDCYCRQKFTGPNCTALETGYYVPGVSELTYEAEQTDGSTEYHNKTSGVTGVLIDGTSDSRTVVFDVDIPKTTVYTLVVRYQTLVEWKDATLKVKSLVDPFSPYSCNGKAPVTNQSFILTATAPSFSTAVNFGDSCLVKGAYRMTLELPLLALGRSRTILPTKALIDSLVILPSVKNISHPKADNTTLFYYKQAFSLQSWSQNKDEIQTSLAPYYSLLYNGGKACSCNDTGSYNVTSCDKDGGQCRCKPNVDGLNCDRCKPKFYDFSEAGCQGCGCDPLGSNSTLCDPVTGQCECKEGVIGKQCTQCKANYYGLDSGTGCLPCLCDQQYSRNRQCNNDGICDCLPGVKAPKCHGCNDTSFNLTTQGCDACHCDVRGSASLTCSKLSGKCPCKTLAVGPKCDSCLTGFYYGLDKYHPTGCLKCQCSGKTVNCSSKANMYETVVLTDLNALSATDMTQFQNWTTTGGTGLSAGFDIFDGVARGIIEVNVNTDEVIYFTAPSKFLGGKRTAYQHKLLFYLKQTDANNPFDTAQGDVILKGRWLNESLVHKFEKIPGDELSEFSVFFGEEQWKVGDANGRNASSYEMVAVLSELKELLIRAKWSNTTGATTSIAIITMHLSKEYKNSSQVPNGARMTQSVESCDCPREFAGDSCERCADGYTREVPNSGPYTKCVPCNCHGNSDQCDPDTGICIGCKHNTTGDYCERCAVGYYGNATFGSQHACQACSCYGGHNSCDLTADGSFVCNCDVGYEGERCQRCADGYFGRPTELNGRCSPCVCNGNAQTCNRTTGDCSPYCRFNSSGLKCESCQDGFYGDATNQDCRYCNCSTGGSVNNTCDKDSGKCRCLSNIEGRTCSHCKRGAWDYGNETGCKLCECFDDGSLSTQCDLRTGNCPCKVNVTGMKCDRCINGLYGVSLGCVDCDCNMTYSNHSVCDPRNGQCQCKQSSAGGFYGGRQCTECRWDTVGSFPTCAQCNETCYENWYKLIQEEREKVAVLAENVTNVLQTFNGTSVKDINKTLSDLNTKLDESEKIFEGAKFDTKTKEEQYKKINESLVELKRKLDQADEDLTDILSYLVTVVARFDGTVTVGSTTPPVQANYTTIRNWADRILQEVEANNKTAYQNFEQIRSLYEQIEQYNSSGAKAVAEAKQSVTRLDNITAKIREANSILSQDFYDNVRRNDQTLKKLSQDSEEISRLVNDSALLSNAASEMLDHAQSNITEARSEADRNLGESRAVYNDSIEAERKSYEARNISNEFKRNSSALFTQVENAITEVKTSIDNMAHARANLGNATEIADEVLGITIPVEEQTINEISQHILSINVDEALVNATFGNATAGLKTAEDALRLAERAKNISNTTLQQVKEIERRIVEAEERREETRKLQNSTDDMVAEIRRITSQVENEYSEAKVIGERTLLLLNTTIKDIDESLKCFNESKQLALDANRVANLAYRQMLNASRIHNESETTLRDIEISVNTSYTIAMTSYHSIIQTYQNASNLYEEVKEAEDLLKSYITQRDEMNALKTEVTQLETQLDSLNQDLKRKLKEYESCNSED